MKNPKNKLVSFITCALVLLAFVPGFIGRGASQQKQQSASDTPVTSVLQITGDVTQSTNYRIEGDGLGPYNNGIYSVSSVLQEANCGADCGDWVLDTTSSTVRTVLVDLRQPVPNSGAQQIFNYAFVPTRIIVKCHEAQSGSFPSMKLNQTLSCPTFVRFLYGGSTYRLVMSSGPNAFPDYAETNNAQVTCNAVSSSTNKCIAWTVAPTTQAGGVAQNVARLENIGNGGKLSNLGDFYTTFLFNVTNP
jgi:hypothetical protein